MVAFATIDKEKIDEAYRYGLVKPNEYSYIRDNIVMREIFLRTQEMMRNFKFSKTSISDFYCRKTGHTDLLQAILSMVYAEDENLLIDVDDIQLAILSDIATKKAMLVRDLGDLNKSELVSGNIIGDKDSIRALEYLLKYKKGMWELLSYIQE